jgi:hypothetical protein
MGQSVVSDLIENSCRSQETDRPLRFLPAALAERQGDRPFVAIVRNRDDLCRWLGAPFAGLQWLQVEGLLGNPEVWMPAAHPASHIPLDVVLSNPAAEFSELYRLVDVCAVREVRVTMPAMAGFLKALRLAASLSLPVRVLPGQPTLEVLTELTEALDFYLHGSLVEVPVEFFHSLLAAECGADTGSLWMILEEDPAAFLRYDAEGHPQLPRSGGFWSTEIPPDAFVENHLKSLVERGAECATCPWRRVCKGYFKWPDPAYSCGGVKRLFSSIKAAAEEIGQDLAGREGQPVCGSDKP